MQTSLTQQIRRFGAWHRLAQVALLAQHAVFAAAAVAAVLVLVDRLLFLDIPYAVAAAVLGGAAALALLAFFLLLPRRHNRVAYLVDRQAGLKNLVSSGLCVSRHTDEVAALIVGRAERAMQGLSPHRVAGFRLHWSGRYAPVPCLALAGLLFLPQMDLLGRKVRRDVARAEQQQVQKGALKLTAKLTTLEKQQAHLQSIENDKVLKDFNALAKDLMGADKKEALLKLGEFENKYRQELSEQRNFEQAAKALQPALDGRGLPPADLERLKKMLEDLKAGNFKDAAESMRELAKRLQDDGLSAEEKKALARELAKLAEEMRGAGMSKELAEMLRKIQASPENLSDLLKMCQQAGKELNEAADACAECEGLKAMREGLADAKKEMLGEGFSGFDAAEVEKYLDGEAGLGCKGKGSGDGTGGEGIGRGGLPEENMTDTTFRKEKSPSKINKGRILQEMFVSGVPEKGDVSVEYAEVLRSAREHASSSLARDQVPREYEQMVKSYFDSLERRGKEETDEK